MEEDLVAIVGQYNAWLSGLRDVQRHEAVRVLKQIARAGSRYASIGDLTVEIAQTCSGLSKSNGTSTLFSMPDEHHRTAITRCRADHQGFLDLQPEHKRASTWIL